MSAPFDPLDVALFLGRALEALGVPYFLGGSLATSIQGDPRATNDIDLVADIDAPAALRLAPQLGADFAVDEEDLLQAVRARRSTNFYYLPLVTKIDLFVCKQGPFDRSEMQRRLRLEIRPGRFLWVKTPEDSVLRKLLCYRQGAEVSNQQWRDVVSTLRISADALDRRYLLEWARTLGVEDLLTRASNEATP